MARRQKRSTPEPAAEERPAPFGVPAENASSLVEVTIRAGHRHRGVSYSEATPYQATPAEVDLLRRFGALEE